MSFSHLVLPSAFYYHLQLKSGSTENAGVFVAFHDYLRNFGELITKSAPKVMPPIYFHVKYKVWLICLTAYQFLIGYLMLKFDSFVNV